MHNRPCFFLWLLLNEISLVGLIGVRTLIRREHQSLRLNTDILCGGPVITLICMVVCSRWLTPVSLD